MQELGTMNDGGSCLMDLFEFHGLPEKNGRGVVARPCQDSHSAGRPDNRRGDADVYSGDVNSTQRCLCRCVLAAGCGGALSGSFLQGSSTSSARLFS